MTLRCAYIDLDGTLLGLGASLMHDGAGAVSVLGVRAIEACLRADVEVVFVSGRKHESLREDARLLGAGAYIFEAGAALVIDGEETWFTGAFRPDGDHTIHDQIEHTGAPGLLLDHYAGRLEHHEPWHLNRDVSHLFRGLIDAFEADELLAARGIEGLRLIDNGVVDRRSPALAALPQVRAYHLVPEGASKAGAVAAHMRVRGYAREDCIGVGNSREDMTMAEHLATFWLVANAVEEDPTIRDAMVANVRVAAEGHGAGVYEAVVTTLACAD